VNQKCTNIALQLCICLKFSKVHVTERAANSRQQISNWPRRPRSVSKLNQIFECAVRAWRVVEEGLCTSNRFARELSFIWRQHLPDPPDTINHGVVKVESWVTRAGEDVVAWITAKSVVTTAVDADLRWTISVMHFLVEKVRTKYLHCPIQVRLALSSGSHRHL
jgi:hypothetical protein